MRSRHVASTASVLCVCLASLASATACKKERAFTDARPSSSTVSGAISADTPSRGRDQSQPASGDETFVIKLERTGCYGVCPIYTVELRSDGTVDYRGERFVGKRGPVTHKIPAARVEELAKQLEDNGLLAMTWKDPCDSVRTDAATVTTTFVRAGRKRIVRDYHGDGCVPSKLRELEDEIDRVAESDTWTKCPGADYCMR
jgi:hypothetical protein